MILRVILPPMYLDVSACSERAHGPSEPLRQSTIQPLDVPACWCGYGTGGPTPLSLNALYVAVVLIGGGALAEVTFPTAEMPIVGGKLAMSCALWHHQGFFVGVLTG